MEESEQQRPPAPPVEDFSDLVARLLLHTEEIRSQVKTATADATATTATFSLSAENVISWQQDLEDLLPLLETLSRRTADVADPDSIEAAMFQSCQIKAVQLAQLILQTIMDKYHEPITIGADETLDGGSSHQHDDDDGNRQPILSPQEREALINEAQGAIARLVELNFILIVAGSSSSSGSSSPSSSSSTSVQKTLTETVQSYVKYQRLVLRQRAKPAIAKLVEYRKEQESRQKSKGSGLLGNVQIHHDEDDDDDDDDDDDNGKAATVVEQHHAPVLAHVLGQAAALIHPLLVWKSQLPPSPCENLVVESIRQVCVETVKVLDEQTQILTKTVSDWFWQDKPIEMYLQQSAEAPGDESCKVMNTAELGALDGLVQEMGYSCDLQSRYVALVASANADNNEVGSNKGPLLGQTLEKELLPEWTWKYAALERFLAVKQWQAALAICQPVQIVLGVPIQVPSVVEDAQFLSTRALERSATTRSSQALGTVAHAVSHDIWSTDTGVDGSVYQALLEQRGCWSDAIREAEQNSDNHHHNSPKQQLDFASALAGALDEDMVQAAVSKKSGGSAGRIPNAPSSGGFLGLSLGDNEAVLQMQIDVRLCVLNGTHAAAAACRALVEYLDSLLSSDDALGSEGERSTAMVQLAREELHRYAGEYEKYLESQISLSITEFAGGARGPRSRLALDRIYDFFANENYAIDVKEMQSLEEDERLVRDLDKLFSSSMFLEQISQKGEANVLQKVGDKLVESLTEIVSDALFIPERKVTDWGALLFWKEIRRLQSLVAHALTSEHADQPPVYAWAKLSQISTVLQLESPSEWLIYRSSTSVLTTEELELTMSLRSDFSIDAIRTVLSSMNT